MKKTEVKKFTINLLKFSAPGLAVFFAQLQMGATLQVAAGTALLVMYGILADFFTKLNK